MRFPLRLSLSLLCVAAIGTITLSNFELRSQLRARDTSITFLEKETRLLRQQLEAERILAAGQSRLLRQLTTPDVTTPPTTNTSPTPGPSLRP
jgi:hypothetical protein